MMLQMQLHKPQVCGLFLHQGRLRRSLHDGHQRQGVIKHRAITETVSAQAQQARVGGMAPGRTKTALKKLPKAELEEEMKLRGLNPQGTKQDLVERLHAFLSSEQESASNTVAKGKSNAPEGWPFEAEGGEMDLPSEIEALLEQKTAEQAESPRTGVEEEPGNEGLPMLGTNSSPEDLQGLPKKELQDRLAQRGLPKSGNKAELAQRLHASLMEEQEMVLQDQLEAQRELQRQFQESVMSSGSRMDEEEQQDTPGAAVDESQDDSFDEWALEMEGEYQSPEDDAELSFEDSTVAGTTPGAVRDQEGEVLQGRFNRARNVMDMYEYQGTKAAELAGEDYAAQNRSGGEQSQAAGIDSIAFQQRGAAPVDSLDEEDSFDGGALDDAEEVDDDVLGSHNDLKDGFSMAAEQEADGFDADVEERLAREAEESGIPMEYEGTQAMYIGHRNYQKLSSRSPDDIEEDLGVLDAIIRGQSSEEMSETQDQDVQPGTITSMNVTTQPQLASSTKVLKKPEPAPAAIVGSQGTSSLDYGTAAAWMSTRLPEAVRLGFTPTKPASGASPFPLSTIADTDAGIMGASSPATTSAAEEMAGKIYGMADEPMQIVIEPAQPLEQQQEEAAALLAGRTSIRLDTDLLDELTEDVLGQPEQSLEDAVAAQLLSMEATIQEELDGAKLLEAVSVAEAAPVSLDTGLLEEVPEDVLGQPDESPEDAAAAQLLSRESTIQEQLEGAELLEAAAGDAKAVLVAETGPNTVDSDLLVELTEDVLDQPDETPEDATQLLSMDSTIQEQLEGAELLEGSLEDAEALPQDPTAAKSALASSPAMSEPQAEPSAKFEKQQETIQAEQLESAIEEISEAVALEAADVSLAPPREAPLEDAGASTAGDSPPDAASGMGMQDSSESGLSLPADPVDSPAEDAHAIASASSLASQQEIAALRAEMAQKQGALAAIQSQVAAVGRSSEGNSAQIAALQGAVAGLQSQRLDLQRADLSGRLAVLQDIAAQANFNASAKEDLQQQLQGMRSELAQLEGDLSSRDMEAADLSRKLAHARVKLGDPTAAPPANGTAQAAVPGAMRARLGMGDELHVGGQHSPEIGDAPQASTSATAGSPSSKDEKNQEKTQPGVMVAAGLFEAFKVIGGMFRRPKKPDGVEAKDETGKNKRA